MALGAATSLAFVADTVSITIMEIVDNGIMLLIPGAMDAQLDNPSFWGSLAVALGIAGDGRVPGEPMADRAWPGARRHPRAPLTGRDRADQAAGPIRFRPPKAGRRTSGIVTLPSGCW